MFSIAFLFGLYANCILLIGLANLYNKYILLGFTIVYVLLAIVFWEKFDEQLEPSHFIKEIKLHLKSSPVWLLSLLAAGGVMVMGTAIPETAYDALWYHLTLPKLYLEFGGLRYIPGGLLYYSAMPKVGEMFYTTALAIGTHTLAHLIHLSFAMFTGIATYCVAKKYTSRYFALLAVVIFFSNIVVLWEATTAYIDIIRAFFEIMAVWGILNYVESKEKKWLIESAILFGLALETKLVALSSFPLFMMVLLFFGFKKIGGRVRDAIIFMFLAFLVPLPWFVFSYVHTGNPIYPLLSNYPITLGQDILSFPAVATDIVTVFIKAADPVSPIYLMLFPLMIIVWSKLIKKDKLFISLSFISLIVWTLTPKTGGGRFLLPYLPLLSITISILLKRLGEHQRLLKISLMAIMIVFFTAVGYRIVAQVKSIPVILGLQSRQEYLGAHLSFSFGDYYDNDGKLKQIIGDKTVLLYGFHNLYYLDVPFIDSSYVQRGDQFSFIATQNTSLPKRFAFWKPIYSDPKTKVMLYTSGQEWVY